MKKYYFIVLVVLAASLAACTRENVRPLEDPFAKTPWALDETLPVPIQFGHGNLFSIDTKVSTGEATITDLEDKHFAVVAVSDFAEVEGLSDPRLLLNGVAAMSNSSNMVEFLDESGDPVNHYYPMPGGGNPKYDYTFYAYRTKLEDDTTAEPALTYSGSLGTSVSFELSPSVRNVDVLWAKAQASGFSYKSAAYTGFNAEYLRTAKIKAEDSTDEDYGVAFTTYLPQLTFEHSAACIHIKVKAEDAAAAASFVQGLGDDCALTVENIRISNVYTHASLNVSNGALTNTASTSSELETVHALQDGSAITPVAGGTEYGTGFFIIPGANTSSSRLHIYFQIRDKKNVVWNYETDLPMPVNGSSVVIPYAKNTAYTYNITIKENISVSIKTSLDSFDSYDGSYEDVGDLTI